MKSKIERLLYRGKARVPRYHVVETIHCEKIYVADYAKKNNGDVVICDIEPDIPAVILDNSSSTIPIYYDAFRCDALRINNSMSEKQCECVLFPTGMNEDDWILFIETKYTENDALAQVYPCEAVDQIGKTALFFRNRNIISGEKEVTGIIGFPILAGPFTHMYWTTGDALLKKDNYARDHNIHIEIANSASITSDKELVPTN